MVEYGIFLYDGPINRLKTLKLKKKEKKKKKKLCRTLKKKTFNELCV